MSNKNNCIYKKGKDGCSCPEKPNCGYFKLKEEKGFEGIKFVVCTYDLENDPLISYRLESRKRGAERKMEDYER